MATPVNYLAKVTFGVSEELADGGAGVTYSYYDLQGNYITSSTRSGASFYTNQNVILNAEGAWGGFLGNIWQIDDKRVSWNVDYNPLITSATSNLPSNGSVIIGDGSGAFENGSVMSSEIPVLDLSASSLNYSKQLAYLEERTKYMSPMDRYNYYMNSDIAGFIGSQFNYVSDPNSQGSLGEELWGDYTLTPALANVLGLGSSDTFMGNIMSSKGNAFDIFRGAYGAAASIPLVFTGLGESLVLDITNPTDKIPMFRTAAFATTAVAEVVNLAAVPVKLDMSAADYISNKTGLNIDYVTPVGAIGNIIQSSPVQTIVNNTAPGEFVRDFSEYIGVKSLDTPVTFYEVGMLAGIVATGAGLKGTFEKVTIPKAAEFSYPTSEGVVSVWKGISIEKGATAKPIIGIQDGKVVLGTPKVDLTTADFSLFQKVPKIEAGKQAIDLNTGKLLWEKTNDHPYTQTATQTKIFRSNVEGIIPEVELRKFDLGMEVAKATEKVDSKFVAETFSRDVKYLEPKLVDVAIKFTEEKNGYAYGSLTQEAQMPKGTARMPADIDLEFHVNAELGAKFAQELLTEFNKLDTTNRYFIEEKNPMLIQVEMKDGSIHHAVDIHAKTTSELGTAPEVYGLSIKQDPIKIEGVDVMRLSEQGIRKGPSSTLAIKDYHVKAPGEVIGTEFFEKGVGFATELHRIKDTYDFFAVQEHGLIPSIKNPITRMKAEIALKEMKELYPKEIFEMYKEEPVKIPLVEAAKEAKVKSPEVLFKDLGIEVSPAVYASPSASVAFTSPSIGVSPNSNSPSIGVSPKVSYSPSPDMLRYINELKSPSANANNIKPSPSLNAGYNYNSPSIPVNFQSPSINSPNLNYNFNSPTINLASIEVSPSSGFDSVGTTITPVKVEPIDITFDPITFDGGDGGSPGSPTIPSPPSYPTFSTTSKKDIDYNLPSFEGNIKTPKIKITSQKIGKRDWQLGQLKL